MSIKNTMTIGELAAAADVNVETIRYYQRRALLPVPERPPGGIRRYGPKELERLVFIKTAQSLGFSLNEVADLLRLEDGAHCQEASALAQKKLLNVREKLGRLQRIEQTLISLLQRCEGQPGNIECPLMASLHEGLAGVRQ